MSRVIYDTEKIGKQYFTFAPLREDFATWLRMLRADVDYVYSVR